MWSVISWKLSINYEHDIIKNWKMPPWQLFVNVLHIQTRLSSLAFTWNAAFHYQKNLHSVYEVNNATYTSCIFNESDVDNRNWSTKGGRSIVPLNETRPYFFMCIIGDHCQQGMKLALFQVLPTPPTPPSPPHLLSNIIESTTSHLSTHFFILWLPIIMVTIIFM